ncbi:hypothetical protein SAMN05216490_2559 [Mucilaginibacter mallensis]|uniref:Uncharacterized protein n=1 Tax=Mucilaginibacter mallensis TaxID=652787 RepID=A0A1H1XWZ1_MUCMA|nr:hypothetical protein SAMN05216490_2559 [Mucilaginibacter mallensis]
MDGNYPGAVHEVAASAMIRDKSDLSIRLLNRSISPKRIADNKMKVS